MTRAKPHLTILLVEDDRDVREMIGWMLRRDNITTVGVASSQEALELIDRDPERFDAAVCDLMLTGSAMDGLELAEHLVHQGLFPVVIVTAAPTYLRKRPVPDHIPVLTKPFEAADLRSLFEVEGTSGL